MARKPAMNSREGTPRDGVIDALLALAAEEDWDYITLNAIAERAGISLADLRDLFPSKGAILGAFIRRIDRAVLEGASADMADQEPRERVLDLMLRRFEALLPHKAALKSIRKGFAGDIPGLLALNQQALNSWRYLLASVEIETEGPLGMVKIQGAILVFARAFEAFLADPTPELSETMAKLDSELKRGEWVLARAEGVNRLLAPFRGFFRAARAARPGRAERDWDQERREAGN